MGAGKNKRRRCLLVVVGLIIFLTDVRLLNAATLSGSGSDSGLQQTQTSNNAGVANSINGESQPLQSSAKHPPDLVKPVFHNPIVQLVGDVTKGAAAVLDKLNPLKRIFSNQAPSPITTSKAATTTIATSTQHSTSPAHNDPVGVLLSGVRNGFGAVLGGKQPTTALAKTTVAPPAGGHGRGFPAVMSIIENIAQKLFEIIGALLHWFDYSEPSYLISRVKSLMESLEALQDIYLERDMKGGIGEIPKHVVGILNNIKSLADSVQNNKNFDAIKLLAIVQSLSQKINNLKDDFIEPVSTTPIPGGLIGNILHGIGGFENFINPHNNPKTNKKCNHTGLEQLPGEFGQVIRNTGKFINTLGEIEEIIQSHHPGSNLLQFIGKIKDLAELCFTNDTLDDKDILDVLQMVWFPNTTLSEIIVDIGKALTQYFPENDIAKSIGMLLQQKLLVDIGLNILVRSSDFLCFGNIKYYLLRTFAEMGNTLIGNDLNKLIAGGIDTSDLLAETLERFLKTFYSIVDSLFDNIQQLGRIFKLP